MDSFYSTMESFRKLHKQNIFACGTISKHRIPEHLEIVKAVEKMKVETSLCYSNGEFKLFVWKTKKQKVFYVLSTIHDAYLQETSKRYETETKKYVKLVKPEAVEDYNLKMREVDLFDQNIRYYSFIHGAKKWYKKIAYFFLEAAIINSSIIYNELMPRDQKQLPLKQFKEKIIMSLLRLDDIIEVESRFDGVITEIDDCDFCNLDKLGEQRDCQICSNRSQFDSNPRKRTGYYCKACDIPVCAVYCYDFHRKNRKSSKTKKQ